jgi:hypothetical protein
MLSRQGRMTVLGGRRDGGCRMSRAALLSAAALAACLCLSPAPAQSPAQSPAPASPPAAAHLGEVDVALVLAVDISFSMDLEELALQRSGYVEALRSPEVHKAIEGGATGRIAVTFFEWAGTHIQHHLIPWTVIDSAASANAVADLLERQPTRRGQRTSVSGAIDTGARLLEEAPLRALRQVIDVSGDGPNNMGRIVTVARDEALAKGVTINGLPVVLKRPGYLDIDDLDMYYEDCVIGGRNAFSIAIRDKAQFAQTIRTKLVMEISEAPDYGNPLIQKAQARIPRVSCTVGEDMWRDRMRQ